MPTEDRSASGAMVRTIIRRVNMRTGLPPKQQSYVNTGINTLIMFKRWRMAATNRNETFTINYSCSCK